MKIDITYSDSGLLDMDMIIRRLTMYGACAEAYTDPSQENFVSGVTKLLIGVGDLLGKLAFTFKANTTRFYKDLKRSEMTEFSESHLMKINKVESASYEAFMDISVPGPTGLNCDYLTAVEALSNLYKTLDITVTMEQYGEALTSVFRSLSQENGQHNTILNQLAVAQAPKLAKAKAAYAKFNNCFSKIESTGMEKFSKAYKSMSAFREVRQLLIAMEPQLQQVSGVYSALKDVEAKVDAIISHLNKTNTPVAPSFVKNLADEVRYLATLLDMTATANTAQSALEHNHIVVLNTLYDAVWPV